MKKVVFDIETSNDFFDVGLNDMSKLDMSVCCIYDYETDKYLSFTQENLKDLWPYFEKADQLIGYNIDHFDIPVLAKYYSGDLSKIKTLDLLKEVKKSLGKRLKLDSLAEATLGKGKSAHGGLAVTWWRQGEKQKVIDYCIDDVKITKDIYEYALKNGLLKYKEKDTGETKEIKIDTSDWNKKDESTMTFSLPF
jgi:DEAD/DEAH box helicase domain-containing protein